MSKYTEQQTEFKDADLLVASLTAMGFTPQLHATAQQLTGYQGDKRADVAEIIIPRSQVGFASNDIGFKRNASGAYGAIISAFDSSTYDATWMKKLKATYCETGVMRQAKRAGLTFTGKKTVNGKQQLQFVKA